MCVCSSKTNQFSNANYVSSNSIQFNSVQSHSVQFWHPKLAAIPTGLQDSPTRLPPVQTLESNGVYRGYPHFCLANYKFESSYDLPPRYNNWLEQHTELCKMLNLLLEFIIKNTNTQPGEKVCKVRSKKVSSARIFAPWSQDMHPSQHMDVFTYLEAPWMLLFRLFYGSFFT